MKTRNLTVGAALVAGVLATGSASAAVISLNNAGFETGTLAGWTSIGAVAATPSTTVTTFDSTVWTITAAGTNMAQLESTGASIGTIEATLGLAAGTLNALNTNPNGGSLTNGSALYQGFLAAAGDTLSFAWNYVATDYIPYNDPAFAIVIGPNGFVDVLASIHGLGLPVGTSGNSGWYTESYAFAAAGAYTLAFVTTNDKDQVLNSFLHIDDTVGSCDPNCPTVPEPGTLGLLGLGLTLMGIGRRRKVVVTK